jgi:hypothetical protein
VPEAAVFVLRAAVLVLLWGFVIAAVVAVRHDVFGTRPRATAPAGPAPPPTARPAKSGKAASGQRAAARALVVLDGPLAGSSVPLSGLPISIGRAPDCTIVLPDDFASSHHARLSPGRGGWQLEDTGSTNGTFYAGERVAAPVTVVPGQRIKVGGTQLELRA